MKRIFAGILTLTAALMLFSCNIKNNIDITDDETALQTEPDETAPLVSDYGTVSIEDRNDGKTVICLDAGHGFGDVGCQSPYGFDEKDITLEITNKVKAELEKGGAEVVLTHDGNTFPSVSEIMSSADALGIKYKADKLKDNSVFDAYERSVWLNVLDAEHRFDLFVSIHVNSINDHPEISGFSLDYYENNPSAAFLNRLCGSVGDMLEDKFSSEVRIFEDNYEEAYVVNKCTNAPSVLIETGYATNKNDAVNLKNEKWQQSFAENLAEVLLDHLK